MSDNEAKPKSKVELIDFKLSDLEPNLQSF